MNEVTETAGSGGAVAPSSTAQTPAQGPPTQVHEVDVATFIATAKDSPERRNALFAEMRKQGLLGEKPKTATPPASAPQPAPSQSPAPVTTTAEVDLMAMRKFDRAINTAGVKLTEAQYDKMESLFTREKPSDPSAWVTDFLDTWGLLRPSTSAAATPTAQTPPPAATPQAPLNATPASNVPPPPAPQTTLEERNVLDMTDSDKAAYRSQFGDQKFKEKVRRDLKGKPAEALFGKRR